MVTGKLEDSDDDNDGENYGFGAMQDSKMLIKWRINNYGNKSSHMTIWHSPFFLLILVFILILILLCS